MAVALSLPITPLSDSFYDASSGFTGIQNVYELLSNVDGYLKELQSHELPYQKSHDIGPKIDKYRKSVQAITESIKNFLEGTDFANTNQCLINMQGLSDSVDIGITQLNRLISTKAFQPHGAKQKVKEQMYLASNLQQELNLYQLLSSILKVTIFVIRSNNEDDFINTVECDKMKSDIVANVKHINQMLQTLPPEITSMFDVQMAQLHQLFSVIGIHEFFDNGSIPRRLYNTVCDLPKEMTTIVLECIRGLHKKLDKNNEALACYKQILQKNPSITYVTVQACKDIVKLENYQLALELLDIMEQTNIGKSDLVVDVNILKLFCYVGLDKFTEAMKLIPSIPKELTIKSELQLIQLQIYDALDEKELATQMFHTISTETLEPNPTLVTLVSKYINKFNVSMFVDDVEKLESAIKSGKDSEILKEYVERFRSIGVTSEDIVCGLILSAAVVLEKEEVVKYILSKDFERKNFLAYEDADGSSAIAQVLLSKNIVFLDLVRRYLECHVQIEQVVCEGTNLTNILGAVVWPQFETLGRSEIYQDYLLKLYTSDSLSSLNELLGEIE